VAKGAGAAPQGDLADSGADGFWAAAVLLIDGLPHHKGPWVLVEEHDEAKWIALLSESVSLVDTRG